MTSQINPNNVDGTYPVAGQDNDSQGFRDNFTNIRNNLSYAKAEIEDLQNKAVLKTALLNRTLSNDLFGNAIVNPALTSWRETYNNIGAVTGSVTINFVNGNFQKITMAGSVILNFSWPSSTNGQYASIKLWVSNPSASYALSFPNTLTLGDPDTVSGFSGNTITFSASEISNSTDYFFEIFTVDGGSTLGIKDLIRNRDFDGNTAAFTDFSASGNVLLGSQINATVGSNVVVRSNISNTSTTNQSLVVQGGAGIASNLVVGGNVISGPVINSGYFFANVVTDQNLFANTQYHTFVANAAPHGTVANLRFTLPAGAENGREIVFRTLVPITSCFVSNGAETSATANTVHWIANSFATSGNVTAKFVYNSTVTRWIRVN